MDDPKNDQPDEIERRRDEVIKRMLMTPPQPKTPSEKKSSRASFSTGETGEPET